MELLENGIKEPVFVHYTAEYYNRPWYKNCTHPLKSNYLYYYNISPWKDE